MEKDNMRLHNIMQSILYRVALVWRCHQKPERSFFIRNRQLPLCARCCGILLGIVLSPIALLFTVNGYFATMLLMPCIVDGGTQAVNLRQSNHCLRFVSGILFGIAFPVVIFRLGTRFL